MLNTAVIIDANHCNRNKNPLHQFGIAVEVLTLKNNCDDLSGMIKGLMVESYIEDGNQPPDGTVYGKSITDGCLGWQKTERLILNLAEKIK